MPGWLRARWALVVAALVIAVPVVVLRLHDSTADPPLTVAQSRPAAEVHVMRNGAVPGFLRARGVTPEGLRLGGGRAVVVHLTWTPLRAAGDLRYEVLLAGNQCQPGVVDSVLGVPQSDASLGFDGFWNDRIAQTPWLRGDRDRTVNGGYTNDAQIASVPASYGEIWVVGRILDACGLTEADEFAPPAKEPEPVVGVALTEGDRIWWVDRVSG